MRPLLAAFVLLVGVTSTEAADCIASKFAGAVPTCDCPVGTGPSGSLGSRALPVKAGNGYGGASDAAAASLVKANLALDFCTDLLPGYKVAAGAAVLPTACVKADGYCIGYPAAFPADYSIITTGSDTDGYTTPVIQANLPAGTQTFAQNYGGKVCPTNTVIGDTGPFTLDKCMVTNGFYLAALPTGSDAGSVLVCPVKKTCPTGVHAAAHVATVAPVVCVGAGGNTAGVEGTFFCPEKTYGTLGTTLAASKAALTGLVVCGAGSGVKTSTEISCLPTAGFYGVEETVGTGAVKTTAANTACPTGITGLPNKATLTLACTGIKAGYTTSVAIPVKSVPGPVILTAIIPCPVNKYCAGEASKITISGLSASFATHTAVAKNDGPAVACRDGTGNSVTGATAQGVNAISPGTACVDLLPNYGFKQSASSTAVLSALVKKCVPGEYGCAGKAGLLLDYTAAKNTIVTGTGITATDLRVKADGTDAFEAAATCAAAGSFIQVGCPTGSTNTAAGDTISSCLLQPGQYIDESALNVPKSCPASLYCTGGGAVGTAGGSQSCPTGSTLPKVSLVDTVDTRNVENSNIKDCLLDAGFHIAPADLNLPVPCPAGYACGGGNAVGTAGGSVICPTGSTNEDCVTSSMVTTVNLTPASQPITVTNAAPAAAAAASPDVTVTNNIPSASSASSNVASFVVLTVAAIVAL